MDFSIIRMVIYAQKITIITFGRKKEFKYK